MIRGGLKTILATTALLAFSIEANLKGGKETNWERDRRIRRTRERKQPLTPKQKKARAKSKRASKTRNKLRCHPNYKVQLKNERKSRSISK